ncbi:hypothetical protein [Pseudoxanthomonas dokdonensis]|uniref:hypothetical protein n=1 Tax=Pseudoxanthomonas dokdonensis TaxID=344882 RepID=UPI0012ED32FA|nr:hypothetical protein [Pseudoxanthomonas dokdonensis]
MSANNSLPKAYWFVLFAISLSGAIILGVILPGLGAEGGEKSVSIWMVLGTLACSSVAIVCAPNGWRWLFNFFVARSR